VPTVSDSRHGAGMCGALQWKKRTAKIVPEPYLRNIQTGCSYDRLSHLQKWQLMTYGAHVRTTFGLLFWLEEPKW
jgi:hypothetical protein